MTQEEKAKRYDEAIEKAKDYYYLGDDKHKMAIDAKAVMEYIFPELKESENKRMIQYFKDLAPFDNADELYEKYGFSHKDAIAWLEKQGEHANFLSKIQIGDKVTRNKDGVLVNLSQLKRIAKPAKEYNITGIGSKNAQGKLGEMIKNLKPVNEVLEQKPADKVEPKFKIGDWVMYCSKPYQITGLHNDTFTLTSCDGSYFFNNVKSTNEPVFHLWTIQDAKDGDVLADGVGVILFRKIGNKKDANVVDYHCAVFKSGSFIIQKGVSYWGYSNDEQLRPATKEQCERFFATMRDVGYEWDADKKELKKLREE